MRYTAFVKHACIPITFLFFAFSNPSFSQQGSLLFHHLKLEDGLSELTNQYIYKDSKGFIWITSINGLNRFDGTKVKCYWPDIKDSLAIYGDLVQSHLFEDDSSNLWFTTFNALNCYNRKHDFFYHYLLPGDSPQPLDYNAMYLDTDHQLWLTTNDNILYTFNIQTHHFQFVEKLIMYSQRGLVIPDKSGHVKRIFTYTQPLSGILEVLLDDKQKVIDQNELWNGSHEALVNPKKIVVDGDSLIWIVANDILVAYNFQNQSVRSFNIKDILTIETYQDSLLLISVSKKGVYEFNKKTFVNGYRYMVENSNPLSLLANTVQYISKDMDDGYWFSSTGFGLSYAYADKKKFSLLVPSFTADGVMSNINPIGFMKDHDGHLLCTSKNGGVFEMDNDCRIIKNIIGQDRETEKRLKNLYHIFEDSKDHIWLSSYDGLSLLSTDFETIRHMSDFKKVYLDGLELKDGRILFVSHELGLFELDLSGDSLRQIKPDKYQATYLFLQQDKRGRIWMSEGFENYMVLDPVSFETITEIPVKGRCASFVETNDGQTIWIASTYGLYNIDADHLNIRKVHNLSNGFPSLALNGLLKDQNDMLWMTSTVGIIKFNPVTIESTVYTYEDGLPVTDFNTNASYQSEDGEMWFGSPNGITKFRPQDILPININAVPQITEVLINDQPPTAKIICENTQSTNITELQKHTFSYLDNTLTFTVNSLEYSAPERNKVKYWMESFDKDSIETISGSRIRYPNLPAGKYVFCVQAANSDGLYSDAIRKMQIIINPPFYKTWWFILLVALLTLGPVAYIVYLRISKKIELQNVRLRLYENLHDDIGSRLTAIVLSAEDLLNKDKSANPKVEHISKVAKSIVGNMRRLVWAIDPENDSMISLAGKIRHDKSLILDDAIQFHLDLDPQYHQLMVPGEIRYQLTSIVNEALNNISKYAKAKNVWIVFSKKNDELSMVIRDDGIGFNPEMVRNDKVKSTGYGLGNMEKRMVRVKGNISIQSKEGEGTTIQVTLPLG